MHRYACIAETKSKRSKSIELSDVCVFSDAKQVFNCRLNHFYFIYFEFESKKKQ